MHLLLPQGGVFMVKPIDQKTRDCGNEEVLLLAPASRTRVFQDVAEIEGDGLEGEVYFRPRRTNFKAIDSLLRVDKTLHVFQMTVSTNDKKVSAKALTTLYNDLGVTDKRYERLNLYYVVPPDVFESFKLGVKGTWPPTTTQRHAQRTHLYVLKGSPGQRTAIASPGSQQPTSW